MRFLILYAHVLRVVDGRVSKRHELVQYGELELQFDAVKHGFRGGFDIIVLGILHGQEADIHGDDDEIDPDQQHHHLSRAAIVRGPQQFQGRVHIYAGDDKLLYAEGGHLQTFHRVERADESFVVGRIGGVGENGGGDMEAECVDNDHGEDASEDFLFAHDEVKPRVEHDGLAGDHAIPTDRDDSHRQVDILGIREYQKFEEEAEGMQHAAITRDDEGPKIKTSMSFES